MRRNWQEAPIVFTTACGCPYCGCADHAKTDQENQGDGSVVRFCICKRCSQPYRNVVEPPSFHESGIHVDWLTYIPPNDTPAP